jgi:hypothetical protein
MDDDHEAKVHALADGEEHERAVSDAWEIRQRVFARLIHLEDYARMAMEKAVRILRAYFVDHRNRAPRHGTLHGLMLVGNLADTRKPIRFGREIMLFEIWAFVDHEAYKGLDRYWGRAQAVLKSELVRAVEVELSVFTLGEAERFPLDRPWLAKRYETGIILYDAAMDPPRNSEAQAARDRIAAAVSGLEKPQRTAFRRYRARGFDPRQLYGTLDRNMARAHMHLAEAFGALLAKVADEPRDRCLQAYLGNHPRHDLDLFHRPCDFDLILAVIFYRRAVDRVGMMVEAHARDRPSQVVNAAAYATEFALKILLLRAGYSDDWNRDHIGVDLERALEEAQVIGLPPPSEELARLIPPLSRYRCEGRTPEHADAALEIMPPAEVVETVATLLADIGRMTGFAGLPGEELP